jgi:hypothetical protein
MIRETDSPAQVVRPVIRPTKYVKAMVLQEHSLRSTYKGGVSRLYFINHKALERNIYAPWGRGDASGLEGQKAIPAGNR